MTDAVDWLIDWLTWLGLTSDWAAAKKYLLHADRNPSTCAPWVRVWCAGHCTAVDAAPAMPGPWHVDEHADDDGRTVHAVAAAAARWLIDWLAGGVRRFRLRGGAAWARAAPEQSYCSPPWNNRPRTRCSPSFYDSVVPARPGAVDGGRVRRFRHCPELAAAAVPRRRALHVDDPGLLWWVRVKKEPPIGRRKNSNRPGKKNPGPIKKNKIPPGSRKVRESSGRREKKCIENQAGSSWRSVLKIIARSHHKIKVRKNSENERKPTGASWLPNSFHRLWLVQKIMRQQITTRLHCVSVNGVTKRTKTTNCHFHQLILFSCAQWGQQNFKMLLLPHTTNFFPLKWSAIGKNDGGWGATSHRSQRPTDGDRHNAHDTEPDWVVSRSLGQSNQNRSSPLIPPTCDWRANENSSNRFRPHPPAKTSQLRT